MIDELELQLMADALEALGNSTRLAIFTLLVPAGGHGMPVGDLQQRLGVPASTLSHHISRLVQVGLVRQDREGRSLICKAEYACMDELIAFMTANCCAAEGKLKPHRHGEPGDVPRSDLTD